MLFAAIRDTVSNCRIGSYFPAGKVMIDLPTVGCVDAAGFWLAMVDNYSTISVRTARLWITFIHSAGVIRLYTTLPDWLIYG